LVVVGCVQGFLTVGLVLLFSCYLIWVLLVGG